MTSGALEGSRLLLGVSGSIATYKSVYLVRRLTEAGARVHVVMTGSAGRFVTPLTFEAVSGNPVLSDLFEGPPNAHIELAESVDMGIVAPATANTLARHAAGIADDALGTVLLALRGPLLMAPAMDGGMWDHPATRDNVGRLAERGVQFVGPHEGALASGLSGIGRMAEPEEILAAVAARLGAKAEAAPVLPLDLAGEHVLVTAGPTREPIDPVRFLSNPSSGRMGFAVAQAAARRGARVTLVAGPTQLATPHGCTRVDVVTAADMREAVNAHLADATVLVMAAAVSDYRPVQVHDHKLKKGDTDETLRLTRTDDILKGIAASAPAGMVRVGFAAETRDITRYAREKLTEKGLDLIVANDVSEPGSGFETDTNRVVLISRDGTEEALPLAPKGEVAGAILDRVVGLFAARRKSA
ncbi:MAG: bifunctional phosphopantothenoylcysteine decarboxylase/phosphopantothenate--cysteine ligase CoaBC [Leptospirillia bacterium]